MKELLSQKMIKTGQIYLSKAAGPIGREFRKTRPYVIIDTMDFIEKNPVVCAVPLTTQLSGRQPCDVFIPKDNRSSLKVNSLAKLAHLYSLDKSRLQHFIGSVDEETMKQIHQNIRNRFSL